MIKKIIFAGLITLLFLNVFSIEKIPHKTIINNTKIIDNYFWLRDIKNPKVMEYINQENDYTDSIMKDTRDLQDKLYKEFLSRIKQNDLSVPYKRGNYYYYSRTEKGKNYSIYCRKKTLKSKEEIILDENQLAKKYKFFNIGSIKANPNGDILAYTIDTLGNEDYVLFFYNIKDKKIVDTQIHNISNFVWANNSIIYYAIDNNIKRPYRIYRHTLGLKNDDLLFEEKDDKYYVWVSKSKDSRFIFANAASKETSYIKYLKTNIQDDTFHTIFEKENGVEYYVYPHDNYFYVLTNKNAKHYKVEKYNINDLTYAGTFIKEDSLKTLQNIEMFKNFMVISERYYNDIFYVYDFNKKEFHKIELPEKSYSLWNDRNYEYDTDYFRFGYSSFLTPTTIYDYNMKKRELIELKQYEVLGGYDKNNYVSKYVFVKSRDNTLIPLSIVYKKDIDLSKTHPLILNGYGAYGTSSDPYFSSIRLSLLDRGIIYAIAHIRGGGELGKDWYESGKLLKKKNTFYDFIDCAKYLINKGYTDTSKLIITGGSAGGLLIGAVVNMRPDLFKGAVLSVPFVDVLNTMLDSTLPLTVGEYEEWGNPNEKKYFDYIKSYSPYDNIKKQDYPNILITSSLYDTRVSYWEPLKFCAKLREYKTDNNLLLLKMNTIGGHGGLSGRYNFYKEIAFEYAFIFKIFNIKY